MMARGVVFCGPFRQGRDTMDRMRRASLVLVGLGVVACSASEPSSATVLPPDSDGGKKLDATTQAIDTSIDAANTSEDTSAPRANHETADASIVDYAADGELTPPVDGSPSVEAAAV